MKRLVIATVAGMAAGVVVKVALALLGVDNLGSALFAASAISALVAVRR